MKLSELIAEHREELSEEMVKRYRRVLECHGRIQCGIYIWSDGELEFDEDPQGSNDYLVPRSGEKRELYGIATIKEPFFDPSDFNEGHPLSDNDEERERQEKEIIDELVSDYEAYSVDAIINRAIEEAEEEERDDIRRRKYV